MSMTETEDETTLNARFAAIRRQSAEARLRTALLAALPVVVGAALLLYLARSAHKLTQSVAALKDEVIALKGDIRSMEQRKNMLTADIADREVKLRGIEKELTAKTLSVQQQLAFIKNERSTLSLADGDASGVQLEPHARCINEGSYVRFRLWLNSPNGSRIERVEYEFDHTKYQKLRVLTGKGTEWVAITEPLGACAGLVKIRVIETGRDPRALLFNWCAAANWRPELKPGEKPCPE
jgi:hypothetical protein